MAHLDERVQFLPLFPEETEDVIRARWEAWANEGLTPDDADQWIDVRAGGFWYILTGPGIREAARLYDLMGSEYPAAVSPLWTWGDYLDDLAESYGLERQEAAIADGEVTFFGPAGTDVLLGTQVTTEVVEEGDEPVEFQTTEGGTIGDFLGAPANLTAADALGGSLAATTTYSYVVTAINEYGETIASAEASDTTTAGNRTIDLNWDDKVGATGYRVYRETGGTGGPYQFLIEVVASAYSDTGAVAQDPLQSPPVADTTGEKLTLAITALVAGESGNVGTGAITILDTEIDDITSISNLTPTAGGSEAERDFDLLRRLRAQFEPQGSGTIRDYARWATEIDGVGRATVIPLWNGPGTVLVIVLGPDGNPTSAEIVDAVQEHLDPDPGLGHGQAPVGAQVTVETATSVNIAFVIAVETEPGYTLDGTNNTVAIRTDLEEALDEYVESIQPGQEVVRYEAMARIVAHPGVHDITTFTLDGGTTNVSLDSSPTAEVAEVGTLTLTEV